MTPRQRPLTFAAMLVRAQRRFIATSRALPADETPAASPEARPYKSAFLHAPLAQLATAK